MKLGKSHVFFYNFKPIEIVDTEFTVLIITYLGIMNLGRNHIFRCGLNFFVKLLIFDLSAVGNNKK